VSAEFGRRGPTVVIEITPISSVPDVSEGVRPEMGSVGSPAAPTPGAMGKDSGTTAAGEWMLRSLNTKITRR
jgi:hypothetical protein